MDSPIINKTNGANSSEHGLTKAALYVITAATGVAVALGYISPDTATQVNEALSAFVYSIASVVAAYTAARTVLKTAIAWQTSQYVEDDEDEQDTENHRRVTGFSVPEDNDGKDSDGQ